MAEHPPTEDSPPSGWTPTQPGTYRLAGRDVEVYQDTTGLYRRQLDDTGRPMWVRVHAHITWALLAPDWQTEAPTMAQLERWPWWLLCLDRGRELVAGKWRIGRQSRLDFELTTDTGVTVRPERVIQAAPIQPYTGAGPLWVPRLVACGEVSHG